MGLSFIDFSKAMLAETGIKKDNKKKKEARRQTDRLTDKQTNKETPLYA